MSKVLIVTDSAATIEPEVAEALGVTVVPLTVRITSRDGRRKEEVYQDGVNLNDEELLLRMARERIYPSIVGPTAAQFRRVYGELTRLSNKIISLHSSASLSLVCQEAEKAAREFMGRCDIAVMDSETLSLGLRILVEEAARLANASAGMTEIMRHVRGLIPRIYIVCVTETLDYLEHSRLISPAQAVLGTMLGIRPFLAIEEGRIIPMEKARSRERALDKLVEFVGEFSHIERIAILRSAVYSADEIRVLKDRLESLLPGREFPVLTYGPLLASHIGPDGMGLVVYEGRGRRAFL
ncbi:MAG: DegV family protein [Anaerolineae bacterium]|nr:DegV family protein [Anaerolineae bacterium]